MPAIYAHYEFALNVLSRLPQRCKNVLKDNLSEYILGAQGPDILFYYKPYKRNDISALGHEMHGKSPRQLFAKNYELAKENNTLTAYLCGSLCHYCLDSSMHPLVNEHANTSISHMRLEANFDWLVKKKYNIKKPSSQLVPIYKVDFEAIAQLYGTTAKEIKNAARDMRFFTYFLNQTYFAKPIEKLLGKEGQYTALCTQNHKEYDFLTNKLFEKFYCGVDRAIDVICAFVDSFSTDEFHEQLLQTDFNGYTLKG